MIEVSHRLGIVKAKSAPRNGKKRLIVSTVKFDRSLLKPHHRVTAVRLEQTEYENREAQEFRSSHTGFW
jgi:hypothetical protein